MIWSLKIFRIYCIGFVKTAKSELNFPIGAKRPIGPAPHRWDLSWHLLDAILRAADAALIRDAAGQMLARPGQPVEGRSGGALYRAAWCVLRDRASAAWRRDCSARRRWGPGNGPEWKHRGGELILGQLQSMAEASARLPRLERLSAALGLVDFEKNVVVAMIGQAIVASAWTSTWRPPSLSGTNLPQLTPSV